MAATRPPMKNRRPITDEARKKATRTRQQRSVFNRYLATLRGKRVLATEAKIAAINTMLVEGTKERWVPKFVKGVRMGTERKKVALLPADRARLLARRRDLQAKLPITGKGELRDEFLAILPIYAASQGLNREILLDVGVPVIDLDAAGIE